jgi:hypothetical protein
MTYDLYLLTSIFTDCRTYWPPSIVVLIIIILILIKLLPVVNQLSCFTQLRALLVLLARGNDPPVRPDVRSSRCCYRCHAACWPKSRSPGSALAARSCAAGVLGRPAGSPFIPTTYVARLLARLLHRWNCYMWTSFNILYSTRWYTATHIGCAYQGEIMAIHSVSIVLIRCFLL